MTHSTLRPFRLFDCFDPLDSKDPDVQALLMADLYSNFFQWIKQSIVLVESFIPADALIAIFLFSIIAFIGTLIAIPAILIRLPEDYFGEEKPHSWMSTYHPIIRKISFLLKNGVGYIFLLAGIAMLVLPGQGILTMLIGISLIDFPGKRKFEKKLICLPGVLKTINALRQKYGKPPLSVNC